MVVKRNIAAVLRKELRRPSWKREPVSMGTNTDPYQRAEGRYRLMPEIIEALTASDTPFSILTKGTLLRRDLPLLARASTRVPVGLGVSLTTVDESLAATLEPGTPSPKARLALVSAIREAGFHRNVLVAPVLPFITDTTAHLRSVFSAVTEAGGSSVTTIPLHLRGANRGWYLSWLTTHHPKLVRRYRELYPRGGNAPQAYQEWLTAKVDPLLEEYGLAIDPESPYADGYTADGAARGSGLLMPTLPRCAVRAVVGPLQTAPAPEEPAVSAVPETLF